MGGGLYEYRRVFSFDLSIQLVAWEILCSECRSAGLVETTIDAEDIWVLRRIKPPFSSYIDETVTRDRDPELEMTLPPNSHM
jgi:hypothetical protein